MSANLKIALRFLLSKKRPMAMSLIGIIFGVSLFVLTQAQTSGFKNFFIKTIWGTNGVLRVQDKYQDTLRSLSVDRSKTNRSKFQFSHRDGRKYIEGVENVKIVKEAIRKFRNVSGVSEVVRGNVTISNNFRTQSAEIYGIELESHLAVSDLENQIVDGSLFEFEKAETGILIGSILARRMLMEIGDAVILWSKGENYRFRVAGVFETGVSSIDRNRVFLHLDKARSVLKSPHKTSFLQVNLFNKDRAVEDASHMSAILNHSVVSWQEREKPWLEAFHALQISAAITVFTIILISGLGMFNTLAIIVMEKSREIAILRSIGYTQADASWIFIFQGLIILVLGTVIGSILGAAFTFAVSRLPISITGIFQTDHYIVYWSIWHYVAAGVTTTLVVLVASYLPARKAARLEPANIIRGTGQ